MIRIFWVSIVALVLAAGAGAAAPRDSLLVSTAWLAEHLKDPNLVLLHVGDEKEYHEQHIPGARYVALRDISASKVDERQLTLEMLPADQLRDRLSALGISNDSHVVVYYGNDWVSPSTRVMFTLDYAGLTDISLLDGGMKAWIRDGHEATAAAPAERAGRLSPLALRSTIVDADFVRSHVGALHFTVVDARDPEFYQGAKTGGGRERPQKTGHIAGARSVPFSSVTRDDLVWKTNDQLQALFTSAGVQPGDTVITYCHVGQQATATLFAARLLGHPVLLYDGSFEDWSRRDYPVESATRPQH